MVGNGAGRRVRAAAVLCCAGLSACSWLVDVDDLGGTLVAPATSPEAATDSVSPGELSRPDTGADGDSVGSDGGDSARGADGAGAEGALVDTRVSDGNGGDGAGVEVDSSDASPDQADAGTDVAPPSGGDSGDAGCATSFADAGGLVLFSFDDATGAAGWATSTNGGVTAAPAWLGSAGHTCPGEIQMTVQFQGSASVSPDIEFDFNPPAAWNRTRIHVWMKLQVGGGQSFAALKATQLFIQSNGFVTYTSIQMDIGSTLSDGAWHELVMNLVGAQSGRNGPDVATGAVDKLGINLIPSRPEAGVPPPQTAILSLDDIWLE